MVTARLPLQCVAENMKGILDTSCGGRASIVKNEERIAVRGERLAITSVRIALERASRSVVYRDPARFDATPLAA